MNIRVEYLYRDAGNNKNWGDVVFSNKADIGVEELEYQIRELLIDGEFFVAEKAGLPNLYFPDRDDELDHGWHQFHSLGITDDEVSDELGRDMDDFLKSVYIATRI